MKKTIEQKKNNNIKGKALFLTGVMTVASLFPILFTATACKNPTNQEQLDGSEVQKDGYTISGVSASIIKEVGVTDAEMAIALENLKQAYNSMSGDLKDNFNGVISNEIRITQTAGISKTADVLTIGKTEGKSAIETYISGIPAEERDYTYTGTGTYPADFTNGFDIVKMTNANQAKADVIVKALIGGYNYEDGVIPLIKQDFLNKTNKVILNNGSSVAYDPLDPNKVLYIGVNFDHDYIGDGYSDFEQYFAYEIILQIAYDGDVFLSQVKTINSIKLANLLDSPKLTAKTIKMNKLARQFTNTKAAVQLSRGRIANQRVRVS